MSDQIEIRTISFDRADEILAAIHNRETFEVGGCHDRMSDAVLFVERAIGGEGMTSRTYTKGRAAALIPALAVPGVALAAAFGMAAQNLATLNPDYEIMKRSIDKALRLTYVKNDPTVAEHVSGAARTLGQKLASAAGSSSEAVSAAAAKAASLATEAATTVGEGLSAAAEKTASFASDVADTAATAWNEHMPSKEAVVGTVVLGGVAPFLIGKDGVEAAGEKVISTASDAVGVAASKFRNASPWALVGGAIIGVGAVAAAPFTGGGSVFGGATMIASLTGAAGAAAAVGGIGAAAGAAISSASNEQAVETGLRQGKENGMAEAAVKIQALQDRLVQVSDRYKEQNKFNELIVCLVAVGAGMAACDGHLNDNDVSNLQEFVLGISAYALPSSVADAVQILLASPPTFEQAMQYADRVGRDVWPVIDNILLIASETEGVVTEREQQFLDKWAGYKAMHRQEEVV